MTRPPLRQGPNLLDTSSELIHQGEVTKLTSSSWSREVCTLFLFDHVLIYCRKDLLKRSVQQFRGRINLDTAHVVDLTDGKGATGPRGWGFAGGGGGGKEAGVGGGVR